MGSPFHDLSFINDQDHVCMLDGGKPVCNHYGGPVLHQLDNGILDQALRFRIQRRSGLVKDQYGWIGHHSTGYADTLLLTSAQFSTAFTYPLIITNSGDFGLHDGIVGNDAAPRFTFSGIACYRRRLFADLAPGKQALAPLLRAAAARGEVSGELFSGQWVDIGTAERLAQLNG